MNRRTRSRVSNNALNHRLDRHSRFLMPPEDGNEVLTIQLIVFYKVLGGGWELYDALPPISEAQPAILATIRRLSNHWH